MKMIELTLKHGDKITLALNKIVGVMETQRDDAFNKKYALILTNGAVKGHHVEETYDEVKAMLEDL